MKRNHGEIGSCDNIHVTTFIEPSYLEDKTADSLTSSRSKNTMHFFHTSNQTSPSTREINVSVETLLGTPSYSRAYRYIYIKDSHLHHPLFNAVKQHILCRKIKSDDRNVVFYPGLTMTLLNSVLKSIKNNDAEYPIRMDQIKKIRDTIGLDYVLPDRLDAFDIPFNDAHLLILEPGVIRCVTNAKSKTVSRIGVNYRCFSTHETDINLVPFNNVMPAFVRPTQARNYELKHFSSSCTTPLWPHRVARNIDIIPEELRILLHKNLNLYGYAAMSLDTDQILNEYVPAWKDYLQVMISGKSGVSVDLKNLEEEYKYRYKNQKQSIHIPAGHGRTLYGHLCPSSKGLFLLVEPIVLSACESVFGFSNKENRKQIVVGTSDIFIQLY
jgi:hypothetical protein